MALNLHAKAKADQIESILNETLRTGGSGTDYLNAIRAAGLGYRTGEAYQDYRISQAEAHNTRIHEPVKRAPQLAKLGYDPRPTTRRTLPSSSRSERTSRADMIRAPALNPTPDGKAGLDYNFGTQTGEDQRRYEILQDYIQNPDRKAPSAAEYIRRVHGTKTAGSEAKLRAEFKAAQAGKLAAPSLFASKDEIKRHKILTNLMAKPPAKEPSGAEYARRLAKEGLSYQNKKMYSDLHRAQATEHSKTPQAWGKANNFYNKVWTKTQELLKSKGLPHDRKAVNAAIENYKLATDKLAKDVEAAIGEAYFSMYS